MARPKGTTKPDSLVSINVTLGVSKETSEWYKLLPDGTKSQVLRNAIALYRSQDQGYVLHPALIAALGGNKSHTVEAIILKHFGITPLQWEIYIAWIECDRLINLTAEKLGRDRENVRQNVAKVERKLGVKK
jgi:hypothetical protein